MAPYVVPTTLFVVTPRSVWGIAHRVRLTALLLLFDIGLQRLLPSFVRAFVAFVGGRSLPNIITPSVFADSSSLERYNIYYLVTDCETEQTKKNLN